MRLSEKIFLLAAHELAKLQKLHFYTISLLPYILYISAECKPCKFVISVIAFKISALGRQYLNYIKITFFLNLNPQKCNFQLLLLINHHLSYANSRDCYYTNNICVTENNFLPLGAKIKLSFKCKHPYGLMHTENTFTGGAL